MNSINVEQQTIVPSKVVCIGRNYVEHIHELGNAIPDDMVVFNKPNSAISQQLISFHQEPLHYETELCFLYQHGKFTHVAAGVDLTKRALQSKLKQQGLPWEKAKAFNGSCCFSSFVAIDAIEPELTVELEINGELTQQGQVKQMMYSPAVILKNIKEFMTLTDGDVVMTGTPKGVGQVETGQQFVARVVLGSEVLVEQSWDAV